MQEVLFEFIQRYVSLTEAEKEAISSLDIFSTVEKGTELLREGQRSRDGYFVLSGCLRTYYFIDGEEKTTAFYTETEGITPACVLSGAPSEYFLATTEDSLILTMNPETEAGIFEKFPKFETLCRLLSEELLNRKQLDFDEFKMSSPEQRYLKVLEKRPDLIQRVPQHQLASYLGIKPQSLSRIRARIGKNGAV